MVNPVYAEVREAKLGPVIVQLECADSCHVCLEGDNQDVAHQTHMLVDVLRNFVAGPRHIRFGERGSPALQSLISASAIDAIFNRTHRFEILGQPFLV